MKEERNNRRRNFKILHRHSTLNEKKDFLRSDKAMRGILEIGLILGILVIVLLISQNVSADDGKLEIFDFYGQDRDYWQRQSTVAMNDGVTTVQNACFWIKVTDNDLNLDPGKKDCMGVDFYSEWGDPSGCSMCIVETGDDTGIFISGDDLGHKHWVVLANHSYEDKDNGVYYLECMYLDVVTIEYDDGNNTDSDYDSHIIYVDEKEPKTTASPASGSYITDTTTITLTALEDSSEYGGSGTFVDAGLNFTWYRVWCDGAWAPAYSSYQLIGSRYGAWENSYWYNYSVTGSFNMTDIDQDELGIHYVEFFSVDHGQYDSNNLLGYQWNSMNDRIPTFQNYTYYIEVVYVDDDFNASTPGWQYDHFDKIQDGIDAVSENGTVYVYNGTYIENVVVNKTINLIGDDMETTVIDGNDIGNVVEITAGYVNMSNFFIKNGTSMIAINAGIKISSSFNTISNCLISDSYYGIYNYYSVNNTVCWCTISNNNCGVAVYESNNNEIFHNNFINNTIQANDEYDNTWDNGYPMGGNYWNDYSTTDDYHGISQNESGFDLLVDFPYSNISGGVNSDRWPHVIPDGWMKLLFVPNIILVVFNENVTNQTKNATIANYGTEIIEYLQYVDTYILGINVTNQSEFDTMYMFHIDTNVSVASLDFYTSNDNKPEHLTAPNDECYPKQWHLNNFGVNPGVPTGLIDADIDAPQAWEHITDCSKDFNGNDVVIAIIDSGVDLNHPDIVANLWTNLNDPPGDIADNGIDDDFDGLTDWTDPDFDGDWNPNDPDDDGNGIVDDIHGAEFNVRSIWSNFFKRWITLDRADGSPDDDSGHGTHCAGIICAHGNNGIGATGVCWEAQLMVLKNKASTSNLPDEEQETRGYVNGSLSCFDRCVDYIVQQKQRGDNIKVVSYSAGISRSKIVLWAEVNENRAEDIIRDCQLRQKYQNSIDKLDREDILFVCSAGNEGRDIDTTDAVGDYSYYPAKCTNDNIITVAASDNQDKMADFSNWGTTSVDIVAPGENIMSLAMHGRYVYRDNNGDNKVSVGEERLSSETPAIYPAGSTVGEDDRDCVMGYNLENFNPDEKHDGADNVYDPREHIYRDVDGDDNVSAGDIRLTDVYIGNARYRYNSVVVANDADNGTNLTSFANIAPNFERHRENKGGNNRYDPGEYIYRDNDDDTDVSIDDTRLTDYENYFRWNTNVQAGNSDEGDCLHGFASNERYNDSNNNNQYDQGEIIYIDTNNNMTVEIGEQRLSFPVAGTFVQAVSGDIGDNLTNFTNNIKYSLVTYMSGTSMATPMVAGEVAHFWCQFPDLPGVNHLEVKNWILRKVDPRQTLQNTVVSGIDNDGRLRMISGFDFGDAPDPYHGVQGKYPTVLDGELSIGASHEDMGEEWLGWDTSPEYDANVVTDPPYDVDKNKGSNLGPSRIPEDPHPSYQAGPSPDNDAYDDGVSFRKLAFAGGEYEIEFHIQTENPFIDDIDDGRYDEYRAPKRDEKKIYINAYFDWNRDGDWDDGEHLIKCPDKKSTWWGGPGMVCCYGIYWPDWMLFFNENAFRKTTFTVPAGIDDEIWVRVRLDYGENVGRDPYKRYDSDHPFIHNGSRRLEHTYAHAQFGEVEDYYLYCINKSKEIGEPKFDDEGTTWLTSYTPIELVDYPLDNPYPVENYYRLWYEDEWIDWIEYVDGDPFYLEGEGDHLIEYYGKYATTETIFSEDFEEGYDRWSTLDIDNTSYTWEWTNTTPEWLEEKIEGHFMLLDDFSMCELPSTDSLVSAPISCSIYDNTILEFDGEFRTTGYEKLYVNVSNDYGGNWTNVLTLFESASGPWTIDISNIADGKVILLNFTYSDAGVWGYGALIKNVALLGEVITYSPEYTQYHIVDDTPPTTTITYGTPFYNDGVNDWITSSTLIDLTSTDGPECCCGVKETLYKIDDGEWTLYTAPFSIPGNCTHTIFYYSKDNLNNSETIKNLTVKVDNTVPSIILEIENPINESNNETWIVPNTWVWLNATDEGGCAVGSYIIHYRIWYNGEWTTFYTSENTNITFQLKNYGIYYLEYWVIDYLGNRNPTAGVYNHTIYVVNLYITSLKVGWNLIGIPLNYSICLNNLIVNCDNINHTWENATTDNNPTDGPIVLRFVYGWNRTSQQYELVEELEPGYGYWMYSYYNCTLWTNLTGINTNSFNITDILVGWNLVSLPDNQSIALNNIIVKYNGIEYSWENATSDNNPTGGPIILRFVYGWNRTNQQYELVDELNPGYGYWMYAYYNCTLLRQTNASTSITTNKNQILPIDFNWKPKSQYVGISVQFEAIVTSPPNKVGELNSYQYNIISWHWDFAGLGSSTEQNPSFTFINPGTYPITLTVWDELGNSDFVTYNIIIFKLEANQSFTATKYAQASIYSDSTRDNRQIAQSFTATDSNLQKLSLYLSSRYNKPCNAIIEIQTNAKDQYGNDIPSNTVIALTQISFFEIPSDPAWIDFDIDAILIPGEKYWIVLKDDDLQSTSNYVLWWQKYSWTGSKESYEEGEKAYSSNNGDDWYPNNLGDRFFKMYLINCGENTESEQIFNPIETQSKTDNGTESNTLEIIEDDPMGIDINENISENINPPLKDAKIKNEQNDNISSNETEENGVKKEINKEYYDNFISLIEVPIVIATILICVIAVKRRFKKK